MFSSRIKGDLTPNRLTQAVRQRRARGLPIIDLTESNPTCVGLDYPDDLLAPLAASRGLRYAPQPFGTIEARRAVAAEYARRGIHVDAERVALTASTSEAYSLLFKLLTCPGDEVLVPRPSYPLFELLTSLDGVVPRPYDLEYHGVWSIDVASLERSWDARTRAVLIVTPNNPTGSFVSRHELDRLAGVCAGRGAAIIADEVFADYELDRGVASTAGAALTRQDALVFALGGLSKSVGLPQVKLGWIAAGGPAPLVSEALERLEIVCDTYLSVSTAVQLAAAELLERGSSVRAQIQERIVSNYDRLREMAAGVPSCRVLAAGGGWHAVLQVPTVRPEEELVLDLLDRDGVLAHPGYFFDFPRESFLIVSLLPSPVPFATGIERLLQRASVGAALL